MNEPAIEVDELPDHGCFLVLAEVIHGRCVKLLILALDMAQVVFCNLGQESSDLLLGAFDARQIGIVRSDHLFDGRSRELVLSLELVHGPDECRAGSFDHKTLEKNVLLLPMVAKIRVGLEEIDHLVNVAGIEGLPGVYALQAYSKIV